MLCFKTRELLMSWMFKYYFVACLIHKNFSLYISRYVNVLIPTQQLREYKTLEEFWFSGEVVFLQLGARKKMLHLEY
jgi:hypothetical protein